MFAQVLNGVWEENVEATKRAWARLKTARSNETSNDAPDRNAQQPPGLHRHLHRKVIGGVTAAIAVLALTYSAASALVTGAAGSSAARSDYATVMQAASAEYRRARAECLALPFERRDPCIAEAHANESKMRAAATTAPRKQLSQMRQKSDQLLLAAQGLDNIVIEPACNVVARGSASVCEIQVKGSTVEGPEALAALSTTRTATAAIAAPSVAGAPSVAVAVRSVRDTRPVTTHLVSVSGSGRSHYLANVAGLVSP